ncbi:cell wall-binding repeat-containing protein [Halalkalibacter okhensis]|uniref:cell wall-binding repeat-containing protein n=1 Tax=Halalkalibacter okhensis TaxID=333138 RepID=UPI000690B6CB|nr:cell wall-binding repeat-containing protein [Halalkalibacter okhensis]
MKLKSMVLSGLAAAVIFTLPMSVGATERISGSDRYSTAVEISKDGWESSNVVVLARGDEFPDALAGGPLAYHLDAPVLLTRQEVIPSSTLYEIARLDATEVVILGGEGAISNTVTEELEALGLSVERIGGETRYETAALIAEQLPVSETVVLANGLDFPDALAVAPEAAKNGYPILLTRSDRLSAAAEEALESSTKQYIIGGTAAVNNAIEEALTDARRLGGVDRYETNKAIVDEFTTEQEAAYVATGTNFADALTGSVLAAKNDASILLTRSDRVPAVISELAEQFTSFNILGGTVAISEDVLAIFEGFTSEEEATEDENAEESTEEEKY